MVSALCRYKAGMKRTFIISAFLIALAASVFGSESSLDLTYRQHKSSKDLSIRICSKSIAYELLVRQTQSGRFTLVAPPFLCANIGDTLIIGELRSQGVLSLMLEPYSTNEVPYSFRPKSSLKTIQNPSQNPTLSGIALCFDHMDIVTLSPTMNPKSPLGMGLVAGNANAFSALMCVSQNEMAIENAKAPFQQNWTDTGLGRLMVFSIIGANADVKLDDFEVQSSAFVQNAWDRLLGGGTSLGWNIRVQSERMDTTMERRLGGNGESLKGTGSYDRPSERMKMRLLLQDGFKDKAMTFGYEVQTYEIPIYGGQSQRRTIQWDVGVALWQLKISASSKTAYDADCGKVSDTTYLVATQRDNITMSAGFKLNRTQGKSPYLSDANLKIEAPRAKLEIKGARTYLEMSWQGCIDDIKIKVSVDQDRYLTFGLTFNGL